MRLLRRYSLEVEPKPATACDISLDHFGVLRAARDLETARMDPVQWLPGILGEALDPFSSEFDSG